MTIHTDVTTDELLGLFPPGTGLDSDGTMTVGGCRLDDVAKQFGTPAIVVFEDALRQRARARGAAAGGGGGSDGSIAQKPGAGGPGTSAPRTKFSGWKGNRVA